MAGIDQSQFFWLMLGTFVLLVIEGLFCITVTYNLLRVLIGLEVLIKGVTLFIIAMGYLSGHMALAQAIVITVIVIEVVVVVVAGGLIINAHDNFGDLDVRNIRGLKG